jgi:hypothetical protein
MPNVRMRPWSSLLLHRLSAAALPPARRPHVVCRTMCVGRSGSSYKPAVGRGDRENRHAASPEK